MLCSSGDQTIHGVTKRALLRHSCSFRGTSYQIVTGMKGIDPWSNSEWPWVNLSDDETTVLGKRPV
jgi:hypothetical protein